MKRLVISGLVAVCAIAVAFGAEVVSENVVGFITVNVPAGQFRMVALNFDDMDTPNPTIQDVLGTNVPLGAFAYIYSGSGYDIETFAGSWIPGTHVIDRGDGFWLYSPTDHDFVFQGEVPEYETPITVDNGFQIMSYPFPAGVALTNSIIGKSAGPGDFIYVYNGVGYDIYTSVGGGSWIPNDLVFQEGASIWYSRFASGSTNLNEIVPYSL